MRKRRPNPFKVGQIVMLTRIGKGLAYQGRSKLPVGVVVDVHRDHNWQIPLIRVRRYGQQTFHWYSGDGWKPTKYATISFAALLLHQAARDRLSQEVPHA